MPDIALLQARLKIVRAEQNRQYWLFTRTARGKPVDPKVTREIVALERAIAAARRCDITEAHPEE